MSNNFNETNLMTFKIFFYLCVIFYFFLSALGFYLKGLFINMIIVMKSLFLEAEISQYLIMVSDLKPTLNAWISFLPHVLTNLFCQIGL